VAIVQISQITNRKGLHENLPQLAGAELGWSTDTRQLYIGNGTLEDGAPIIGNTEILTEFSNILNFTNTYTYKGQVAGYTVQTGATPGTPVTQSLQAWLDQFATVKDFGATGDGVTDDTAAINRALFQLYCRETNPQIRRSLFFPAGVYRVTSAIKIPPYATLYGEGTDNSVIAMDDGVDDYVVRTADSLQAIGINIGDAGAITPQYVTVTNMGFRHLDPTGSVLLVQDATNCTFQNVGFYGASTAADLDSDANGSIGVSFASTASLVCTEITFEGCVFSGLVWGVNTNQQTKAVTFSQSQFDTMYRGIVLGQAATVNGGPTGTRITSNVFDNIYNEGILLGSNLGLGLNSTGHNVFYDVGNHFTGPTGTPATPIINILSNNNISLGDMFARTPQFATLHPQVHLNTSRAIATTNGGRISLGTQVLEYGVTSTLVDNDTGPVFTIVANKGKAFTIKYTITRGNAYRTGDLTIISEGGANPLTFTDEYVENTSTGITLSVTQTGTNIIVSYISTNTGTNATFYHANNFLSEN
jgi:hypothetical protein